jgi:hypothetical protein
MNGASSSWWVPLGAAAVALIGVIVGQLLAAAAESRRYRRETKRRDFEHWRDRRFEAYSEFLGLVDSWVKAANTVMAATWHIQIHLDDSGELKDAEHEQAAEDLLDLHEVHTKAASDINDQMGRKLEALPLVSSDSWYDLARKVRTEIIRAYQALLNQPLTKPFSQEQAMELIKPIDENFYMLRESAREEFGIET